MGHYPVTNLRWLILGGFGEFILDACIVIGCVESAPMVADSLIDHASLHLRVHPQHHTDLRASWTLARGVLPPARTHGCSIPVHREVDRKSPRLFRQMPSPRTPGPVRTRQPQLPMLYFLFSNDMFILKTLNQGLAGAKDFLGPTVRSRTGPWEATPQEKGQGSA